MTKQSVKILSIQDSFLNDVVNKKELLELNLVNGLAIKCKIIKYDNFSLLINFKETNTLVYKHSIAFIIKLKKNKK